METTSKKQVPDATGTKDLKRVPALLVTAGQAAAMVGKSKRCWWTWHAAGLVPRPVKVSGSTLWRIDELREWVTAGCPRRDEWEARK